MMNGLTNSLNVDMRLDRLEAELADLKETLASVAGQLLATDAVAPDRPKRARKT